MRWLEITICTTQEGLDAVCARLDMLGVTQVAIEESRESVERFLRGVAKYWDYADVDELVRGEPCVKAYLADLPENRTLLSQIQASFDALRQTDVGMDLGSLHMVVTSRDEEDWANNWKLYYKPLQIGERLLVCPSWEQAEQTGRTVLSIDPGMAFGTGSHHTTRMCLEALERLVQPGDTMLDLGCGSGILSIAGLLLGAGEAWGVDIDPVAEKIAGENAALNDIGPDRFHVFCGDLLTNAALQQTLCARRYAVVTANIVAGVIVALCPLFPKLLAPEGTLIASGIIAERLQEVEAALCENGLAVTETNRAEDWCAVTVRRV